MNLIELAKAGLKKGLAVADENSPTILTFLGASGVFTTAGMAIGATPPAMNLIAQEKDARKEEALKAGHGLMPRPITKWDMVKITWRCYVPTAAVALVSVGCIVGANSINLRRNAALASLYSVTREAFEKYQEKVIEEYGKNKEEKVRESLAQDQLNTHPIRDVFRTGRGDVLFFDPWSARYFMSDPEWVRRCINDFNHRLNADSERSLNCFYDDLGLEHVRAGDDIGWVSDKGLMEIPFITKLTPEDRPCIILNYQNGPVDIHWPIG